MNYIIKLLLNSLYGRFGLSPNMTSVVPPAQAQGALTESVDRGIIGVKELKSTNLYLFELNKNVDLSTSIPAGSSHPLQISLPLAFFTTAYARIHMSKFKTDKYSNHLFYSDTDSVFLSRKLPKYMVGTELGKMKLEYEINEAVFIAPKVYSLKLSSSDIITKVKGSNVTPAFDELVKLISAPLARDGDPDATLTIPQTRWERNMNTGHVKINNIIYKLMVTENKREFIRDSSGVIIDTKPFVIPTDHKRAPTPPSTLMNG